MHGAISCAGHDFDHGTVRANEHASSRQSPSSKNLVPASPELYTILTIYECNPDTICNETRGDIRK